MQLLVNLANDAAKTQIHNDLYQECGGYRQGYGRIEVHSFLLKRRERTLAARSAVLEMLEVKEDRRFGRLDDDSAKVKWMWRVYPPELTTRRHRGRSQAPWTIVKLVRKPSQSIHTSRETHTFRRRSRMPCVFSRPPLLVGDTVEVVSSSATSSTEFASTLLYNIYARVPSKLYVAHTHASTKLNCLQYYY